jgi:two-component system phosphate regulon response regulator OmpR
MSSTYYHILIVDDEPIQQRLIQQYLLDFGMHTACVADGRQMDTYLAEHRSPPVDLIILDLNMPMEDGLSITRRLRAAGTGIPIIMLSSFGDDVDRIVGLEVGVDDYLKKPPNPRELLARVRAVMRRYRAPVPAPTLAPAAASETDDGLLQAGNYQLDRRRQRASRAGHPLDLTAAEFELLWLFAEHPEQALSRDFLSEHLKGYEHTPFDRSIDVQVRRLRKKIEPDPAHPRHILTVRGKGYRFLTKKEAV